MKLIHPLNVLGRPASPVANSASAHRVQDLCVVAVDAGNVSVKVTDASRRCEPATQSGAG